MIRTNSITTVLLGSMALGMASISSAQDTGIKDGSFDSGSFGAWMKTDYDFSNPDSEGFRVTVESETCGDVVRHGFLRLEVTDIPSSTFFDESPKLWQSGIQLEDCDEGTHAILRFDKRIESLIDRNAVRVTIQAYSDLGQIVGQTSRRLASASAPNCGWLTDELALEIPDVAGDLSYQVIFEMIPWGVCGGQFYAEVDLDQIEFFRGTPGETAEDFDPPCGQAFSGRLLIDFGAAPVATEILDSEQPPRNFRRVVELDLPADCQPEGLFGECLAEWPMTTEAFQPATKTCEPSPCPADFDGNGLVDGADLVYVLGKWGPCDGCIEDINGDGRVDGADLVYVLGTWGECP